MTGALSSGISLTFLTPSGSRRTATISTAGPFEPYGGYLSAGEVTLDGSDATEEPLLLVCLSDGLDREQRQTGYRHLDAEIVAGLRLYRLAEAAKIAKGLEYPDSIPRLIGYKPDGADEFVLLRAHDGVPVESYLGRLPVEDRVTFIDQLLIAVRWVTAAGLAHRGLSPTTVRWTADANVVVTHLFTSTLIGTPRGPVGNLPWAAHEQLAGSCFGTVCDQDDIWALARLIVTVLAGQATSEPAELVRLQLFDLLRDAFTPPEDRPTISVLLDRRELDDPLRGVRTENIPLGRGRAKFDELTGFRLPSPTRQPPTDPPAPPAPPAAWTWPPIPSTNPTDPGSETFTHPTQPPTKRPGRWLWGRG